MATAKKATESNLSVEPIKAKKMTITIVGDSDLILCAKSRSYQREEIYKQSHPKGTKIPKEYQQDYCLWEKLITSIHWLHPIEFHDDDYSKYTEEEWTKYMNENQPCILGKAFKDSMVEGFKSFGYKESTGRDGTDLKRTVSFKSFVPITFTQAGYDQHLAQTSGLSRTNVLTQQNVFTGWRADVEITYLETCFPKETIIELFNAVGQMIGVGARRKEEYGKYHVESVVCDK